jgi:hypothetical protein
MNQRKKECLIVVACKDKRTGSSTMSYSKLSVTQDQIDKGEHFYLAIQESKSLGYTEPFVCFDESEQRMVTAMADALCEFAGEEPTTQCSLFQEHS